MDPLPISINQHQLKLIHDVVGHAIADLDKHQGNQFASGDEKQKQHNVATYGTDNYKEAQALVQAIDDQVKTQLTEWQGDPEDSKPVAIGLNSYQLQLLRSSIEREIDQINDSQSKHLLQGVVDQMPESSPNEDSD